MKPFLSACLIVKNEEDMLRRCLESLQDGVDEVIIVDTGSTDTTKEIAKEFTDKVYDFKWIDDFAAARNFAASHATGEWILAIDADECVEEQNLQAAITELKSHEGKYNSYLVEIVSFLGNQGEFTTVNKMGRLYKNNGEVSFRGALHEQIVDTDEKGVMSLSSLKLYHYGYLKNVVEKKNKKERNLKIVKESLKVKKNDGFALFNYGQELRRQDKTEEALNKFIEAYKYKKSVDAGWVSTCLYFIIESLVALKRYDDALKIIQDATTVWPEAVDFMCWKGDVYFFQKRYDDAKEIYESIIRNPERYNDVIYKVERKSFTPNENLAKIYEIEKNDEQALHHYVAALNDNGVATHIIMKIVHILSKYHTVEEVYEFIKQQNMLKTDTVRVAVIKYLLNVGFTELPLLLTEDVKEVQLINIVKLKTKIITMQSAVTESINFETADLLLGVNLGIIDLGDLCTLHEVTKDVRVLEMIKHSNFANVAALLLDGTDNKKKIKRDEYLAVLEKTLCYNKPEFAEKLISYKHMFNKDIDAKLADIFYKNGYEDIALEFYQLADENHISKQGYVNIIEWLISQGNKEEANRIALQAIVLFEKDFRFYKYSLELEKGSTDELMSLAVKSFPDSNWLKRQLLFSF